MTRVRKQKDISLVPHTKQIVLRNIVLRFYIHINVHILSNKNDSIPALMSFLFCVIFFKDLLIAKVVVDLKGEKIISHFFN